MAFLASTAAALGLAAVYVGGGQPQAEGALLFVALGGLGVGAVQWARQIDDGPVTDDRGELAGSEADQAAVVDDVGDDVERHRPPKTAGQAAVGRRSGRWAWPPCSPSAPSAPAPATPWTAPPGARAGAWSTARAASCGPTPCRSAAPSPSSPRGRPRRATPRSCWSGWRRGATGPGRGRETWAPEGNVAYSKICTHVGCPVGLYQEDTHELVCPCHQSTFDVLDGARPRFGPATRPLPQLPLAVDGEGFLVAQSDFTEPVGPGFWNRP